MKLERDVHLSVRKIFKIIGIPNAIVCDGAKAQVQGKTADLCRLAGTVLCQIEPYTQWINRAKRYIGLFKDGIQKTMKETNCPLVLWDYCMEHKAKVNNVTAKDLFQLEGQTPHYSVTGEEADISNLCQFAFYDWCYFRDNTAKFPFPTSVLGRVLGPSDSAGNNMAQNILTVNGRVVPRQTCRPLTDDEISSDTEKNKRNAFDKARR